VLPLFSQPLAVKSVIHQPLSAPSRGVALSAGVDGELYILFDQPPAIWVLDRAGELKADLANGIGVMSLPSDMISDGGMELLVINRTDKAILRFSRRLDLLPPIIPILNGISFEPVSLTRQEDNHLLLLNNADGYVYRYERDGRLQPIPHMSNSGSGDNIPSRIHFNGDDKRLYILADGRLSYCTILNPTQYPVIIAGENITAFTIQSGLLWVASKNGINSINLNNGSREIAMPQDSLTRLGITAIAAMEVVEKQWLWLLPMDGFPLVKLEIPDP